MTAQRILAGRYELVQAIGRGGMGQVWSALDTRLQRQVAVKTVDLDASSDSVAAERFRQEAQATAALSHPNIVTIFDSGVDGETAYIVMELLRGPSLEQLVRDEGALSADEALEYAGQVAGALGAAHTAGIVHRDIKPSNLMLDSRGAIKVVDFGIARLDQERSSKLTATSTVVGSAPYLSPEQATGGVATQQSDLYSLGCVLMTLLTGEPPFAGEHPLSVLHQHLSAPAPVPSSRRPGISPAVDDLVAQLLAKSPADRPASARDVADRIQAIRRGHGGGAALPVAGADAAPTTVLPPVTAAPAARTDDDPMERSVVGATAAAPDRRRGCGWFFATLLLLAALAAGAAWYYLAGPGAGAKTPAPTQTTTAEITPPPTSTQPLTTTRTTPTTPPTATTSEPTTPSPTPTTTRPRTTVTATVTTTVTPTPTTPTTTAPTTTSVPTTPTDIPPVTPPTSTTATVPEQPSTPAS